MVASPIWLERTQVLRSPETGVWHAAVERGHTVAQGAVLGRLTDFFGNTVADIRAPFAGEVLYIVATPAMNKGEPVGMVGASRQ
jgi:predicted deacylase